MEQAKRTILCVRETCDRLGGISRPTLWRWERQADFPRRVRLSDRKTGFFSDEIEAFLKTRKRGVGPRVCVRRTAQADS